ncbi:MAG: hypothetical protein IGR92_04180 [Leptolyngbyaceae cyanobacterium T60_A2020_046]|nr:hypothetical protein [Leptolyngbyaceae cyanobacterium T60_A2020_046]
MKRKGLRFLLGIVVVLGVWVMNCAIAPAALAITAIELKDLSYSACPEEFAEGMVTAGSVQSAKCYMIHGTAVNTTGKPVLSADIFGRIYDANDNPVMQNRGRLGAIDEVPPGESPFELRISVADNQPEPLKLKQFKASGFSGRIRR